MNSKRLAVIGMVFLILAAAIFTMSLTSTTTNVASRGPVAAAVVPGQPSGEIALPDLQPVDYFQRHPELQSRANILTVNDLSDYFQRHSEVLRPAAASPDDYVLRHPEVLKSGSSDNLSDWFLRHPESVRR